MRVMILSPYPEKIAPAIQGCGDEILVWDSPTTAEQVAGAKADWLVSYGHRYLVRPEVLALLPGRAINLHISMLPHNRGADPNFWSWMDATPKGVTIHQIDEGMDTGAILTQREVAFGDRETLATSYARLRGSVEALFAEAWPRIRRDELPPRAQPPGGSLHRRKDKEALFSSLPLGWDTPVEVVERIGKETRRGEAKSSCASS